VKISPEQIEAFSVNQTKLFYEEMKCHLREFYALEASQLKDEQLLREIRSAVNLAEQYGILSQREICGFLNFYFEFGHSFPELPWANEILNDPWGDKVERLYVCHLAEVEGRDNGRH